MAKRFLETLGDAFDEQVLEDVIPVAKPRSKKPPKRSRPSRKRKAFLEAIDEAFESQRRKMAATHKNKPKSGKKSFLNQIEDNLNEPTFEELMPLRPTKKPEDSPEVRFTALLDSELYKRMKAYSREQGLSLREVVQEALGIFLLKEKE